MKVKLEDVCEKDSSNLKLSDVDGMDGDYPIYGAAGYIGNVKMKLIKILMKYLSWKKEYLHMDMIWHRQLKMVIL